MSVIPCVKYAILKLHTPSDCVVELLFFVASIMFKDFVRFIYVLCYVIYSVYFIFAIILARKGEHFALL